MLEKDEHEMNPAEHLSVPFGDLRRQAATLQADLAAAAQRVIQSGWYVLGSEVAAFEQEFAAACGVAHCVGVASGADALYLALAALGIGAGDEVITVANACTYQADAIIQTGALPVLVDIDPTTHTLDPAQLAQAITPRTRAIMPVHLYGRLADMTAITAIAEQAGIPVIEDAAQAHGAWRTDAAGNPRYAGAWGTLAGFSFYPTKNLGAVGDGGAVVTNDASLAEQLRRLRQYGWDRKYVVSAHGGRNSRLDELQAALLRVMLPHLPHRNATRRQLAAQYQAGLAATPLGLPPDEAGHVYHLYVVVAESHTEREQLREYLRQHGIGCDVHYPMPAHLQPIYSAWRSANQPWLRPQGAGSLPHTEQLAQRILSLPLYPELTPAEMDRVIAVVRGFYSG